MRIPLRGAAALAAATVAAALAAVLVAVPSARDGAACVPGSNGCPHGLAGLSTPAVGSPAPGTPVPGTPVPGTGRTSATSGTGDGTTATPVPTPTSGPPAAAAAPRTLTAAGRANAVFATMTRAQRIGQLFMVGNDAATVAGSTLTAISTYHVGNVMLRGRSGAGVTATARVSAALAARVSHASTDSVRLFIATDQEGGAVRVLRGPGFDIIPSALTQGTWSPTSLRSSARQWGTQMRNAGVNLDLAPVLDTVPSAAAARLNPPIGVYSREYGYSPGVVSAHGVAFLRGLADAGVDAAVKHFPGLGRVTANTDTTAGVTDHITTRHDPYLTPFQDAVDAGAAFLMMSTAYYSKLDPAHPAAFSPTVVTGMVRGDLGFTGVVISDDLGNAKQVAAWSPGSRAVQFIEAGGDMVLTVNTSLLPAMVKAVTAKVGTDRTFAAQVDAAVLRILVAKADRGLI